MVVASGSGHNGHAYWFLTEPAELDVVERINRGLAVTLGADVHCATMTLGGSQIIPKGDMCSRAVAQNFCSSRAEP